MKGHDRKTRLHLFAPPDQIVAFYVVPKRSTFNIQSLKFEMSSPEAEALVISTDPLHVRFQTESNRSPHPSSQVACKSYTGAVSFILPGNYTSNLTCFNQPNTTSQSLGG